jgi:hypothetical protein
MTTKLIHPPTESPRVSKSRSNPHALREWGDFLAPKELEAHRVIMEIISGAMRELPRRVMSPGVPRWDQDKLIDFALNEPYPDDIEEQIEQSWRR